MYIYIKKLYIYYIYHKYNTNENNICLQKDAHQFTDHFASLEMYVRVDFEGQAIDILFDKYWIRRCHINIFQPDVYETNAKLIFSKIQLFIYK